MEIFPIFLTLITYIFPSQLQVCNEKCMSMQGARGLQFQWDSITNKTLNMLNVLIVNKVTIASLC
jgi:hypothetical protein